MNRNGNPHHPHVALLSGALLVSLLLTASAASAEESTFVLSAPASVLSLIQTHFSMPTASLADDTDIATFMRRAQREISGLLATEGYFSPAITLDTTSPNGVQTLQVVLGPLTHVSELHLEFKGDLASGTPAQQYRIEQLRRAWPLSAGQVFRSADWEAAKSALLASVTSVDYAAAQIVVSQADVEPAKASAQLMVVIDTGPAFRFGDLSISGLDRYNKNLIERQAPFKKHDAYRRDLLLAFGAHLQSMPQLASAMVEIDNNPTTHQAAPVNVTLTEAKSRRLAVGVGASSNNGLRSEINYLDHNFLDLAWNLSSVLKLEQNRQSLTAGMDTLPDDEGYLLSFGAGSEATQIKGLKTKRNKLGVTRSRSRGQIETRLSLDWQQESRIPAGGIHQTNQALVPDWQWHRRAVDSLLYPRHGMVTELHVGGGSRQLLSNQNFLRSYARQQLYWPAGERDVLSARAELGITLAPSRLGIPQEYLFRAGGSQSVRGYSYQSLGVAEGSATVGGRLMATGSIEYTHWFSQDWGAAAFADTGGVSDTWSTLRLSSGYGSGVRWRSPVGPLALDLAWGQASHSLQLHFALAVAF